MPRAGRALHQLAHHGRRVGTAGQRERDLESAATLRAVCDHRHARLGHRDRRVAARALGDRAHARERVAREPGGREDRVLARGCRRAVRRAAASSRRTSARSARPRRRRGAACRSPDRSLVNIPPPTLCRTSPASTCAYRPSAQPGGQPRVEQLGLQRRDQQARELAVARRSPRPGRSRGRARRYRHRGRSAARRTSSARPGAGEVVRGSHGLARPPRRERPPARARAARTGWRGRVRCAACGGGVRPRRSRYRRARARAPPRASSGVASEIHCRVTAWRSFMPATPTSRGLTPRACAIRSIATMVVNPRFSSFANT